MEPVRGLAKQVVPLRMFQQIVGLQTVFPSWRLQPSALAEALNARVDRGMLRTPSGDSDVLASAIEGGTDVDGLFVGIRSDGTEDIVAASNGGYWSATGNTATLISKASAGGSIASISSGYIVSGSGTSFLENVAVGDKFYLTADGVSAATEISAVPSDTRLDLDTSYAGAATTGAYVVWKVQSTGRTRIRQWMGKYYFANGTDAFRSYDPASDEFRDVGFDTPSPPTLGATTGGSMTTGSSYSYKLCNEDDDGFYGNPGSTVVMALAGENAMTLSGFPDVPSWITNFSVYRTQAATSNAAATAATHYYLTSLPVSTSSWKDTYADSDLDTTKSEPANNIKPPAGIEDFIIHRDRIIAVKGSRVYTFGLDPDDTHTSLAGLYEPHYAPRSKYVGRDRNEATDCRGIFELYGKVFILRSSSLWRFIDQGDFPDMWQPLEHAPNIGSVSRWSVATDGQRVFWCGRKGGRINVFAFDGMEPVPIGQVIWPTLDSLSDALLEAAAGGCGKGYYWLSFDQGSGLQVLEWNTDRGDMRGSWCKRDWRALAYAATESKAYFGTNDGKIKEIDGGTLGDVDAQFDTAALALEPEQPNSWQSLLTEWASQSGATISAWYNLDGEGWNVISGFPITVTSGGEYELHRKAIQLTKPARRCQLRFKSSGDDWIFGGFVMNAEQRPREID